MPRHVIPSFRIANEAIEKDIALMEKYGVEVKCGAPAPSVDELKKQGYTHIPAGRGCLEARQLDIAGDVAGAIQWMKWQGRQHRCGRQYRGRGRRQHRHGRGPSGQAQRRRERDPWYTAVPASICPPTSTSWALALADGVTFAELAAPVKQADGVLKCEKMVLGEADASGRRSPVGSGEFFTVPCDLVISAVGEQVDDALMAANGIELDKKGRPAFQTNVDGVYAAGDAKRGPATVVEGIADAAAFAEAVIGAAHTYDIPEQAYVTKADAEAKKGILEDERVHLLRGRPLPAVRHRLRKLRGLLPQPRQCGHPHGRRQPPDRPRGQDVQRVRQLHPVLPVQPGALPRQVHPVPDH